ncbi:MAG TPA: hypothetical protein P5550_00970 [Bacteroidales bacterium]|nr:hypothetical protein [Bacteroidales bacterium]HRZ77286.1 hypothetical protein [Bacteroidales bacterium]
MKTSRLFNLLQWPMMVLVLVVLCSQGCSKSSADEEEPLPPGPDSGSFQVVTAYDTIRSYPGGGGIFTFGIDPGSGFSGDVQLQIFAHEWLRAELSRTALTATDSVAEVVIAPLTGYAPGLYTLAVQLSHGSEIRTLTFWVWVYDWPGQISPESGPKLWQFASWVHEFHPEYFAAFGGTLMHYLTYPEVLIVEHHTYINTAYEVRLCYHVMVPPYDWSMIRIRRLNSLEPSFAARRETDGSIHAIPIEQYPLLFGY